MSDRQYCIICGHDTGLCICAPVELVTEGERIASEQRDRVVKLNSDMLELLDALQVKKDAAVADFVLSIAERDALRAELTATKKIVALQSDMLRALRTVVADSAPLAEVVETKRAEHDFAVFMEKAMEPRQRGGWRHSPASPTGEREIRPPNPFREFPTDRRRIGG